MAVSSCQWVNSFSLLLYTSIADTTPPKGSTIMPQNSDKDSRSKLFTEFCVDLQIELEKMADSHLESYDEHRAYLYLIANMFETTGDGIVLTDGAKDGGIDFIVQQPPAYSIYQCKCPSMDTLTSIGGTVPIPTYDQTPLDELRAAIEILQDRAGTYDVKAEIRRLRGDYQRDLKSDPESTTLTATLAVMGELTAPARSAFHSYRNQLARSGVALKLLEWKDVYDRLHALETPSDVNVSIDIHFHNKDEDLLRHDDYCYALVFAKDFYDAFRKYEWALFEWNVRYQIPNSPINKRIVSTLKTRKGRTKFHHLNNGLLITCSRYEGVNRSDNRLTLHGAQIVNGCQTVRAICEAYEDLSPEEQEDFRESARVQVKIIRNTDPEFISELVISTNDQNAMNPRNLKSNSTEQKETQRQFSQLPTKWFYERKDGEWVSLAAASSRFRTSDYAVKRDGKGGRKRFRRVDNQKLAQAWYSFLGNSSQTLGGGIPYFEDAEGPAYRRIFKSVPSPAYWSAFRELSFKFDDSYLDNGTPSVHQYLLAYGVAEYISARRVSSATCTRLGISRGITAGILKIDKQTGKLISSQSDVAQYLSTDDEYAIDRIMAYTREVLIELYAFILCRKYAACDSATCLKIATLPHEDEFFERNFDESAVPTAQDGTTVIGPIYEFLRHCIKQYYYENQAEIRAAQSIRAHFARTAAIDKLRRLIVQRDGSIRGYDVEWKKPEKTFLESLPDL